MMVCICRTNGCPNRDKEFWWDSEGAETVAAAAGQALAEPWCGGCSQPISILNAIADQPDGPTGGGFILAPTDSIVG